MRWLALLTVCAMVAVGCASNNTLEQLIQDAETINTQPTSPTTTLAPPDVQTRPPVNEDLISPPMVDLTPLPIDQQYRIGTLANGLTYLLRSNDSPGSNVEIRLLVNAGSAQQVDGSDGSAHFLEHMLFNGTEKYPGNELTRQLQRLGIAFGPDVNAFTSFDETVYTLTANTTQPNALETAFEVLAQWASAATIEESAVIAERGVVRDEFRRRNETVDGIISNEFNKVYIADTPYEGHLIIGDVDKIENTQAEVLRSFYDTWYRPDNMAVVVVGDIDTAQLEALVVEYFGELEPRTNIRTPREPINVAIKSTPQAHIVTHPNNSIDNLSLDFPILVWDKSTEGGARVTLMEQALGIIINNRLTDAYLRGELNLDSAPYFIEFLAARGLRYFGTNIKAADLAVGLNDYMSYLLAPAETGFTENDMERMRQVMQSVFSQQQNQIDTTQDSQFADLLQNYWLAGADIDETQARISRQSALIESFTAEELTNHWRYLLEISGPIIIAVGADQATLPTTAELLQTIEEISVAPTQANTSQISELMEPPKQVQPTKAVQRSTTDGEVTTWTFDNGITVSHRQTDVVDNNFSLRAASAGGWSAFPKDHIATNAAIPEVAADAVMASGVGQHTKLTLDRFLDAKNVSLNAYISQTEEGFIAESASSDAESLFQLLHLFITDPRIDEVAFHTAISEAEQNIAVNETHVDGRAISELIAMIYDGDPAFQEVATQQQLDELTPQSALAIYQERLGKVGDLAVAIVGDISRDTVADLAARYLGSLPNQPNDDWVDLGHELPVGRQLATVELSEGTADGGLFVYHAQRLEHTAQNRVAANLLQGIINNQITDRIREELGASYGGAASLTLEREPRDLIVSFISIGGDPQRLDEIRSVLTFELAILADQGPSAAQMEEARNVIASDWDFINNSLLANEDLETMRYPNENRLTTDNRSQFLASASAADVQKLAQLLYGSDNWLEVAKVLPN